MPSNQVIGCPRTAAECRPCRLGFVRAPKPPFHVRTPGTQYWTFLDRGVPQSPLLLYGTLPACRTRTLAYTRLFTLPRAQSYSNHDIVRLLERIGAEFGACQNAYTTADETVYTLTVPTVCMLGRGRGAGAGRGGLVRYRMPHRSMPAQCPSGPCTWWGTGGGKQLLMHSGRLLHRPRACAYAAWMCWAKGVTWRIWQRGSGWTGR